MSCTISHGTILPAAKQEGEDTGGCLSEQDIIVNSYFRDQGWEPSRESKEDFLMLQWIRTAGALREEERGLPRLPSSPTSVVPSRRNRRNNKVNADSPYILTPLLTSQRTPLSSIPEEDSVSTTSVESAYEDHSSIEVSEKEFRNCCGMPDDEVDIDAICLDWLSRTRSTPWKRNSTENHEGDNARNCDKISFGTRSSTLPAIMARLRMKPKDSDSGSTNLSESRPDMQQHCSDQTQVAEIGPSTDPIVNFC